MADAASPMLATTPTGATSDTAVAARWVQHLSRIAATQPPLAPAVMRRAEPAERVREAGLVEPGNDIPV
jgi:hypothetical protein